MQAQEQPNSFVDFARRVSEDDPSKLMLEGDLLEMRSIRGLYDKLYLIKLKEFLNGKESKNIAHFNFERNFFSLPPQKEIIFKIFSDILKENSSIKTLHIGNNYIPIVFREEFAKVLAHHPKLSELSLRMDWA